MFKESIKELLYDAEMAYLSSEIELLFNRIEIKIGGFNDSI